MKRVALSDFLGVWLVSPQETRFVLFLQSCYIWQILLEFGFDSFRFFVPLCRQQMTKELNFQSPFTLDSLFVVIFSMLVNYLRLYFRNYGFWSSEIGINPLCSFFQVSNKTGRITVSLKQSSCYSTDASFIQEYFVLEEKVSITGSI